MRDLRWHELVKLADSFGADYDANDAYERVLAWFYPSIKRGVDLIAFEENRSFIYALGLIEKGPHERSAERASPANHHLVRRLLFLKPSTFLIQESTSKEHASDLEAHSWPVDADREFSVQNLSSSGGSRVSTNHQQRLPMLRLMLLHLRQKGSESQATVETTRQNDEIQTIIATDQRVFKVNLPTDSGRSPELAVSRLDGKVLLEQRLLPAGILPHGVKGMRLLDEWDKGYRGNRQPLWDAGRPSRELTKVVTSGTIRPTRTLELGCGTGTDAIYLAGLGFEVTAIDIAPSALRIAQQKAQDAGVHVQWLLADVLAAPNLEPFDFIYDRGCYHEVRSQNLSGYLTTLAHLSRPSSRFLLLAGNANDPIIDYGPPRVTEEELRDDFSKLFEFEWLRESRFEIAQPGAQEPLAWAALLKRKQ